MNKLKLRLNRIYNYIFGEKFYQKINFEWQNKPSRYKIIQDIINKNKYQKYLEIGCDNDELFSKIEVKNKIGVDPIQGGTERITSDEFFQKNKENFDIIFIDGLHEYEQVKKDINNSLKFLDINGLVVLHDCLPCNYLQQAIPRSQSSWTGDVWKAIVEVRTKENLNTCTCEADMGLSIIKKRKNLDPLKIKIDNFKNLKFKFYYNNYRKLMNVISHDKINHFIDN